MLLFFDALIDAIVANQSDSDISRRANWNGPWQERTHAFNGRVGKIRNIQRRFSKFGDEVCQPCLLTQVFRQLHPQLLDCRGARLPFFECYGMDCCYLADVRDYDGFGFPVAWRNECLIEVENDLNEFVMTMRGLLDVIADHRVGIFFDNLKAPTSIEALTERFRLPWESFVKLHPFAREFNLAAVVLPNRYDNTEEFRGTSRYVEWRELAGTARFVAV